MALFAITLTIQPDATARCRYQSALHAIRADASLCWDESGALLLVESNRKSSKEVAANILESAVLSPGKDVLVVINLSSADYCVFGRLADAGAFESLMTTLDCERTRAYGGLS